jgi:Cu+-exporting ATPase
MFEKKKTTKALDPICGMRVEPARAAATREHDGTTFYFCAEGCATTFDADPHRYGHLAAPHSH